MRLPKRGERGFTLIELLIVVAILGVLAAVVIPNVTQFFGAGEQEAKDTELANIQAAVSAMMVDNQIATLPNPVIIDEYDMSKFPDALSDSTDVGGIIDKEFDPEGFPYDCPTAGGVDNPGYVLFGHDITGVGNQGEDVNYVATRYTAYYYTVAASGTVHQEGEAP